MDDGGGRSWVKTDDLLLIELEVKSRSVRTKLTIGPGEQSSRETLFDALTALRAQLSCTKSAEVGSGGIKVFLSNTLLDKRKIDRMDKAEVTVDAICAKAISEFKNFWVENLPKVQGALQQAWKKAEQQSSSPPPPDSRL